MSEKIAWTCPGCRRRFSIRADLSPTLCPKCDRAGRSAASTKTWWSIILVSVSMPVVTGTVVWFNRRAPDEFERPTPEQPIVSSLYEAVASPPTDPAMTVVDEPERDQANTTTETATEPQQAPSPGEENVTENPVRPVATDGSDDEPSGEQPQAATTLVGGSPTDDPATTDEAEDATPSESPSESQEETIAAIVSQIDTASPDEVDDFDYVELIGRHSRFVDDHPTAWKEFYELVALKHFVGDVEGYRDTCRQMLARFVESKGTVGRHELLFAYLFFPSGHVTEDILDLAKQHAEGGNRIRKRMLGLAYYRLGEDEQALPLLEAAAAGRLIPDSKITSLLCLALVQLRTEDLDAARKTIHEGRTVQHDSPEEADSRHRQPWGCITSLWREVQAAMELAGLHEAIPELPPTYAEWPTTEPVIPIDEDE